MNRDLVTLNAEDLLAHVGWLRSLARSLVRDPHLAEDLSQETCVAALENPPPESRSLRSWLKVVLRNFAYQGARRDLRRLSREQRAASKDEVPSTLELVERVATQRRVVEAVLSLDEPYLSAVLLRYFQDLPPRKIAVRLGVPVATVKTRLQRGLLQLRGDLDREYGGERHAWIPLLLPLAGHPSSLIPTTLGAVLMNAKLKFSLLALLLFFSGVLVWNYAGSSGDAPKEQNPVALQESGDEASNQSFDSTAPRETRDHGDSSKAAEKRAASHSPDEKATARIGKAVLLPGKVIDVNSHPEVGITVVYSREKDPESGKMIWSDDAPHAISGTDGRFQIDVPERGGLLLADSSAHCTVMAGVCRLDWSQLQPVVMVAPRISLGGRVVDESGQPLTDALLSIKLPKGFRNRFTEVLDASNEMSWKTISDAVGRFHIPEAPHVKGARFEVFLKEYEQHIQPAPEFTDVQMEIVLKRKLPAEDAVQGIVVDSDGLPVSGAHVAHGVDTTVSDELGRFAFNVKDPSSLTRRFQLEADSLIAVKEGYMPGTVVAQKGDSGNEWPESIVLQLGGEPLSIAGRVTSQGKPAEGMRVWAVDPTFFGALDPSRPRPTQVENILAGATSSFWHYVETDSGGHFELHGLLDRSYRLHVMDPETLLRVERLAPAGADEVEIELPEDSFFERVAGRVVDREGIPVPAISISPMCDSFSPKYKGQTLGTRHSLIDGVTTDAEGRFQLARVPQDLVYLRLDGDAIVPLEYGRGVRGGLKELAGEKIEDLEITISLRCHVKVELADPELADEVAFFDEDGNTVRIDIMSGHGRRTTERSEIVEGSSAIMAVIDAAQTLALYKNGQEVKRLPVRLAPGEVNYIRP
ncbi:MAG: sigma-70 family RNA polymerase sigma factor [Planctomycetota bacterium]